MSEYEVTPLFSTPLLQTDIGALDPLIVGWVRNLTYPKDSVGYVNSAQDQPDTQRGFDILDNPQLQDLKQRIRRAVDYYVYELLDVDPETRVEFQTSWINRVGPGDRIRRHYHPNSIISGVYYIDTNPGSAPITFYKSKNHLTVFPQAIEPATTGRNWNQYNTGSLTIPPKNGTLLLWPSHIDHEVAESTDEQYRYGLAFNMFVHGSVGTHPGKLEL